MVIMSSQASSLNRGGQSAGLSVLDCCKLHIPRPQLGWLSRLSPTSFSPPVSIITSHRSISGKRAYIYHRMCEEVQDPSKQVPKAIVGTIILNTLAGLVFLIPLVFVLPNTEYLIALASGQPVPSIMKSAIGNSAGAFVLLVPLAVLAILCGIGCTTAVSRSVFAFARDGGIPYSNQWRKVNKSLSIPFNAMMLGMAVEIALGLIYFGSSTAFSAFSGVGVITLTVSYACPIAVSFIGGRRQIKNGQFDLGGLGVFCNIVALGMIFLCDFSILALTLTSLAWSILVVPLFCMPTSVPVTADTVNYAPVVFVGFIVLATGWYWVWGLKKYVGPPTVDDAVIDIRVGR